MNRKQFGILIVLLVVIGGAAWFLQKDREHAASSGEAGTGQKLVGDAFPMNDVKRIRIQTGTNELNLVNKGDLWRVQERYDYPANFSMISGFLLKVRDLKVIQNEPIGPSQLPRLELGPPGHGTGAGTLVDFENKDDKSIKSLTLGKKHLQTPSSHGSQSMMGAEGMADGRYVLVNGNSQNALLIADPLNNIEAKPEEWLDKDFIRVERPKTIAVSYPATTNSWKLVRDTESGDWKLAEAKADQKLDAARVSGVSNPFSAPSFSDVESPDVKTEATGLDRPTVVIVDTFDDLTYTIKIGKKMEQNYPITVAVTQIPAKERPVGKDEKPEEKAKLDQAWAARQKQLRDRFDGLKKFEHWVYLVPTWNVDPVLKERKELLAEKKDDTKPAEKTEPKPGADDSVPGISLPGGK